MTPVPKLDSKFNNVSGKESNQSGYSMAGWKRSLNEKFKD
jgi:hypothetical protein